MRKYISYFSFILLFAVFGCNSSNYDQVHNVDWDAHKIDNLPSDTLLQHGETYLSIYSEIYSQSQHRTHNLTATISLRNTNKENNVFIHNANYYDGNGNLIRNYINEPIFLSPMETIEIVIHEKDREGGTGANFNFEWSKYIDDHDPLFEGVMISTSGSQGLSFTTSGITLK